MKNMIYLFFGETRRGAPPKSTKLFTKYDLVRLEALVYDSSTKCGWSRLTTVSPNIKFLFQLVVMFPGQEAL